jgi:tetratricopeptide (TPR) repeat protein
VELNQTAFWPMRFNQGFSFLFTLPATLGTAGVLAFLFLLFSFIFRLKQSKVIARPYIEKGFLVIVAGLSFLIICLFVYPAFFTQLLFVFLGLGLLTLESTESLGIEFYSGSKWQRAQGLAIFLAMILLLTFVLFAFYSTGQKYAAAIYYRKGLLSSSLDQSLNNFDKAARWDSQSDQYWRTLSQALLLKSKEITEVVQFQNMIVSAINSGRRAIALNPMDALNWSNLANIYENLIPTKDADVLAEQNYRKAIEREPRNPQGFVDLARVFIISADQSQEKDRRQEKLNQAKSALQESIGLKADYAPAHFLIAQIYIWEGNLTKAIERVEEIKRTNWGDAGLAFQLGILYYRNNQIELAQSEFERAVALNENYSNARYFLGLIYDQKGQKQKAIAQFEKIEELNPDNQEIKNILVNLKEGRAALGGIVPPAQPPVERTETPLPEVKKQ